MPDQAIPIRPARTNALRGSIHELVNELEERIQNRESFDNPKLTETADRAFGGTRAEGKYTARDAYDALEVAVNKYLLEKHARALMQMNACGALASAHPCPPRRNGMPRVPRSWPGKAPGPHFASIGPDRCRRRVPLPASLQRLQGRYPNLNQGHGPRAQGQEHPGQRGGPGPRRNPLHRVRP